MTQRTPYNSPTDAYGLPWRIPQPRASGPLLRGLDFSSVFLQSISAANAALLAQNFDTAMIGLDTSQASTNVRAAILGAGMSYSAYRLPVAGSAVAGVNNTVTAIDAGPVAPLYLCLDCEPTKGILVPVWELEAAMDAVDAAVTGTTITPMWYSGEWVGALYPGYVGPSLRPNWVYWGAWYNATPDLNLGSTLAFGFSQDRVYGHQYGSAQVSIGNVDLDVFAAPAAPTGPDVPDATTRINTAIDNLQAALQDLAS